MYVTKKGEWNVLCVSLYIYWINTDDAAHIIDTLTMNKIPIKYDFDNNGLGGSCDDRDSDILYGIIKDFSTFSLVLLLYLFH
jgi:hypothetical protein